MDALIWNEAVKELSAKNYTRARELFGSLGENNEALLQLGYLYQEGLGGDRDPEKAHDIYLRLSEVRDAQGTYFLAKLLMSRKQIDEALRSFEKAADLSHVSGAYWAAKLHGGLYGHRTDAEKHVQYLRRAASLGHVYAKRDLALCNLRSDGGLSMKIRALSQYLKALAEGFYLIFKDRYDHRIR